MRVSQTDARGANEKAVQLHLFNNMSDNEVWQV
jgi:hypothetical protein